MQDFLETKLKESSQPAPVVDHIQLLWLYPLWYVVELGRIRVQCCDLSCNNHHESSIARPVKIAKNLTEKKNTITIVQQIVCVENKNGIFIEEAKPEDASSSTGPTFIVLLYFWDSGC